MESVSVLTNNKVTITDKNGVFNISSISPISLSDTITVSFIGYITKQIARGEITDSIIYMTPKVISINEVTIIGGRSLRENIKFEELSSMKYGVFAFGIILVEDSIYVIGGDESRKNTGIDYYEWENNFGNMQIYDIEADQWSVSDIKFSKRAYHNTHYYDDKIYVLGGKSLARNPKLEYLNEKVEVYDLKRNTVYSSSSNPHQAVNFASGVFEDNIIVMNGSVPFANWFLV